MLDRERLEEILNDDSPGTWEGDNAFQGLQIIAKYVSPESHDIIGAAEHDVIYSVDVDEILKAGITEEDAKILRELNWMIDCDCDCLACFV